MPIETLIQEGNLGLLTAVDNYTLNDGITFADYAAKQIYQAIENAIAYSERS